MRLDIWNRGNRLLSLPLGNMWGTKTSKTSPGLSPYHFSSSIVIMKCYAVYETRYLVPRHQTTMTTAGQHVGGTKTSKTSPGLSPYHVCSPLVIIDCSATYETRYLVPRQQTAMTTPGQHVGGTKTSKTLPGLFSDRFCSATVRIYCFGCDVTHKCSAITSMLRKYATTRQRTTIPASHYLKL